MAATILDYVYTGVTERGVELSEGQILRPWKDDSWTKIRVGVRATSTNDPNTAIGQAHNTPLPAGSWIKMGICSGTSGFGSASTTHGIFTGNIGTNPDPSTLTYRFSTSNYYYAFTTTTVAAVQVGTSWTKTAGSFLNYFFPCTLSSNPLYFMYSLDVERTSASVCTMRIFNVSTLIPTNLTRDAFLSQITSSTPSLSNYTYQTAQTLSVDESANGVFDYFNIWWNRSYLTPHISDVAVVKLA